MANDHCSTLWTDRFVAGCDPKRNYCIPQQVCDPKCTFIPRFGCIILSNTVVTRQKSVPIVFVESDGTEKEVMAEIGKNLLDVAHSNNVELEGMYRRLESLALSSRLF